MEELIPEKHLVRIINQLVDSLPIKVLEGPYRGGRTTSYHPKMMLKVILEGVKLYNDIVYSLTLDQGQKVYILLMCEHQSKPHPQMPFRLLRYNVATIADHLEQNNAHIPIIVNIVFYHGKEPWNYSTALADYYKDRELGVRYLDMAPFILVQLPASREDEVYRDKDLGFCFAAFRCTSSPDPYSEGP